MVLDDRFNFAKLKPFIEGSILMRLTGHLNNPIIILQAFCLACITMVILEFIRTGIIRFSLFISTTILLSVTLSKKISKSDQLVTLYFIWKFSRFGIFFAISIALALRFLLEGLNYLLYPLLIACLWIPSLEFLPMIRKNPYPFFFLRLISTIFIMAQWYHSGTLFNSFEQFN